MFVGATLTISPIQPIHLSRKTSSNISNIIDWWPIVKRSYSSKSLMEFFPKKCFLEIYVGQYKEAYMVQW